MTLILAFLSLIHLITAQNAQNASVVDPFYFDSDPYLQYRPEFACSLPVQILLTGIVLTLISVLLIHLIFTAQYHWPLAPVNYVLQLSSVTTLLISLIAMLHVIFSATISESMTWPYMLSYIAIGVPPSSTGSDQWSSAEWATWLVMNAATSGLIQITHIQFLTYLYPSRLEGRLIFFLFGPLAVVAAVMQLIPIQANPNVTQFASFVRNVCNATLSLLCTAALILWGAVVNRRQAWRTDGGTAAFGAGTLFLSLLGTGLNFLYVPREEEYLWLPGLMWAVVLWQSFLGWWWWVGAGSGGGVMDGKDGKEGVEEMMSRVEKREKRRRQRTERRKERKDRARSMWKGLAGAFANKDQSQKPPSLDRSHSLDHTSSRLMSPQPSPSTTVVDSAYELTPARLNIFKRWSLLLRHEHQTAAREQAAERIERLREMERGGGLSRSHAGWGFGSFGLSVGGRQRRERSQSRSRETGMESTDSAEMDDMSNALHKEGGRDGDVQTSASDWIRRRDPESVSWWGPLRRWRLQDSTRYGFAG